MGLSQYVRDTQGQGWELQPSGHYKKVGQVGANTANVNSLNEYFGQQAQTEADSAYKPLMDLEQERSTATLDQSQKQLTGSYGLRGMTDSSYYLQDQASNDRFSKLSLAANLGQLNAQRGSFLNDRMSQYTGVQREGDAYEQNLIDLERKRVQDAEDRRIALEEAARERAHEAESRSIQLRMAQLQEKAARASASGSSSSGGLSTRDLTDLEQKEELAWNTRRQKALDQLRQEIPWATVWNSLKAGSNKTNKEIDMALGVPEKWDKAGWDWYNKYGKKSVKK
jgi:hypothetical protein